MSEQIYQIIFIVLSVLSCLCLMLIFIAFIVQKSLRLYSNWQILFLSVSTFISCISYLINYKGIREIDQKGFLCQFQGFVMLWSDMSLYFWTILINYSIFYYTIHFENIISDVIPLAWWIGDAVIGYFIPFSYALLLFSLDKLGENEDYCWIREGNRSEMNYPIIFTYGIAWISIVVNIILSTKVIIFICQLKIEEQQFVKDFVKKLLMFPIIQVIASLPLTIYRILYFIPSLNNRNFRLVLKYLGLDGFALMGIFIFIIFGKNMNIYENVFNCFGKKVERTKSLNDDSNDNIYNIDLRPSILE